MSDKFTDKQVEQLKYIIKDWDSEKQNRKAVSSLIELKLKDSNELLLKEIDNRLLRLEASFNDKFATKIALDRSEGLTLEKLDRITQEAELTKVDANNANTEIKLAKRQGYLFAAIIVKLLVIMGWFISEFKEYVV